VLSETLMQLYHSIRTGVEPLLSEVVKQENRHIDLEGQHERSYRVDGL
jgi:hypothetical protein